MGSSYKNPDKKYKELKQKQKSRIADFMYQETNKFFGNTGKMPVTQEER